MPSQVLENLSLVCYQGLTVSIRFDIIRHPYGGGRSRSLLVGPSTGEKRYKLEYRVLPQAQGGKIDAGDPYGMQTQADYIWDLFCRSKAGGNIPITFFDIRGQQLVTAIFEDDELSYSLLASYLWSTGINLVEHRVGEFQLGADDVTGANPQQI